MNSAIRTESFRRTFYSNTQLSFAGWLRAESQHYRIDLGRGIVRSVKLCQSILREFDMWPEDAVNASRDAQERKQQEHFDEAATQLKNEIVEQKAKVDQVSNELFQLRVAETWNAASDASLPIAFAVYEAFREWLKSTCSWKIDRKIELALDAPTRLKEIEPALFALYSRGHDGELGKMLEMCATTTKADLLKAINKLKRKSSDSEKVIEDGEVQTEGWKSFLEEAAKPLATLRTKWWLALESVLAAASEVKLKDLKSDQKHAKTAWYDNERVIIESKFDELRKALLSTDGLLLTVSAHTRGRGIVYCEGFKEVPVKVRSAVQICTGDERMCAKFIHFPVTADPRRPSRASEKVIRTFGQFASVCDYDARNRIMTFLSKDSVGVYKFDESFKHMELMKIIDLGVRSTLTEFPFTDVLLLDSTVYVTDSSGGSQAIDIHNDQTSSVVSVHAGAEMSS